MYNRGEKEMRKSKANDGIKLSSTNDTQHFLHDVFSERKEKRETSPMQKEHKIDDTMTCWRTRFQNERWELPLISHFPVSRRQKSAFIL